MNAYTKFFFRPGDNERIETTVHLDPESRSAIFGTVLDGMDLPVRDALVILFVTGNHPDELAISSQRFTDDDGHFFFGPLESGKLYLVKVFQNAVKLRELEILTE